MRMWDVAIVNYESLRRFFVWDIRTSEKPFRLRDVVFCDGVRVFKSIVIDECHRVKDPSAQQPIFTRGLGGAIPMRLMLSGTPIVNKPDVLLALYVAKRLRCCRNFPTRHALSLLSILTTAMNISSLRPTLPNICGNTPIEPKGRYVARCEWKLL